MALLQCRQLCIRSDHKFSHSFAPTGRAFRRSLKTRRVHGDPASSFCPYRFCGPARGGAACSSQKEPQSSDSSAGDSTTILLAMGALLLAGAATLGYPLIADPLEDLIYSADAASGVGSFGPADLVAGLLWGLSLFYASPLQQLLLFLGKIETERPSDWIIMNLARGPLRMDILDVNEAPTWLSYVAAGICLVTGLAMSFVLQAGLGDSIWALSTGTGACLAAGVYEVGRPTRLNREQTLQLDQQWKDFVAFANARLVRSGRCHESELAAAFRRENPRYRSRDALPDTVLRDLIRNWHPDADRTPNGYYRNLSLVARVNAFTGRLEGGTGTATLPAPVAAPPQAPRSTGITAAVAVAAPERAVERRPEEGDGEELKDMGARQQDSVVVASSMSQGRVQSDSW